MNLSNQIIEMHNSKKIGFLGTRLVEYASQIRYLFYMDDKTEEEGLEIMLNEMKGKKIMLNFSYYRSEIEEERIRRVQPGFRKSNLFFQLNVAGIEVNRYGGRYVYNGSAEVLDCEVKRDINNLRELGFIFEYNGIKT